MLLSQDVRRRKANDQNALNVIRNADKNIIKPACQISKKC